MQSTTKTQDKILTVGCEQIPSESASSASRSSLGSSVRCPQCGSRAPLRADGDCADCRCTPETRAALTVVTHYDPKPIPSRDFDWSAVGHNYEGGDPVGYGRTREAAIADLAEAEAVQP